MITVLCHGVFDVLHVGHLRYLEAAKRYGDYLIVSVTSDRYVNKGPGRPHFTQDQRMEMLRSLDIIDEVILSDEPTAVPLIRKLRPSVYAKGPDYSNREDDPTGMIYAEEQVVKEYGGEIIFTDTAKYSASKLINAEFDMWTLPQRHCIETIKAAGGIDAIQAAVDKVAKLKAVVAGECIWDVYRYVTPQGLSSKSPSLSVRFEDEVTMLGGAWAIAAHCREFCETEQIVSGTEHTKIRYIDQKTGQRLFEVCEHPKERPIAVLPGPCDIFIAADFGHGFWGDAPTVDAKFLALNVQTNSSNFGFNRIKKWKTWSYLVADKREVELDLGCRNTTMLEVLDYYGPHSDMSVTLGPNGSLHRNKWGSTFSSPAFADSVVDTTGAGDAYFALTSLLVRAEINPTLIPFLGNVFAGLKTRIVGNAHAVSKASLLKACAAILS